MHDLDSSNERRTLHEDAFDSINNGRPPSQKQNISGLGGSDFESIEPSRPSHSGQDKKPKLPHSSPKNQVNSSTVSDLYNKSSLPASRKHQL